LKEKIGSSIFFFKEKHPTLDIRGNHSQLPPPPPPFCIFTKQWVIGEQMSTQKISINIFGSRKEGDVIDSNFL
jgi:hypothetical protein